MAPSAPFSKPVRRSVVGGYVGSDSILLAQIQAGDPAAFEELFHTYHAGLCAFAFRCLGSREIAEDVVQEVFLFVWDRRQTLRLQTSLRGYLFAAVRNAALSYLRHQRVEERSESHTADLFAAAAPSPEEELQIADLSDAVRAAVDRLPTRCRLIFTLHRERGLTYGEIAEVLGLSRNTIEVQMGRALKALRTRLAEFLKN